MSYDPADWYWQVAGDTDVWSSARLSYVSTGDAEFQEWATSGNSLTLISDTTQLSLLMTTLRVPAYLMSGLDVTFALNSAISATYALDPTTLDQVSRLATDSKLGWGFPGETATFNYPDITGTPHGFAETEMQALYVAMRDYINAVTQAVASLVMRVPGAALPSNDITI